MTIRPLLALFLAAALCAPARAARVVSLMPSYTEIVFALGAGGELVGVTNFCDWPSEAKKIERTGDYLRPSVEKIYSLKPDVVFAGDWASASSSKQLSAMGVKVVSVPQEKSVADIYSTIRLIAAELGRKAEGEKLVKRLKAELPPAPKGRPLRTYIEVDAGGWTSGGESFLSDAVRLAGGENVFGGERRGYFQASWEQTVLLKPEAAVLLGGSAAEFGSRPLAGGLPAVKNGRLITALNRDIFSRPGPRLFAEIRKLSALLHDKE